MNSPCPLKQFKYIFGKEGKGVHSYRVFNIAIADVILTIIGASIISYTLRYNFFIVLIILLLVAIVLHRLFCVNTTINKLIFGIV